MTSGRASTFGDVLRRFRTAAEMTQEELAEASGLSPNGISDLERGVRNRPRRDTIRLLADALELGESDRQALLEAARRLKAPLASANLPAQPVSHLEYQGADGRAPFVGRTAEVALIERHLDSEGPPLLLFAGEPGIGKSRLLEEAGTLARARGQTILVGRCNRRSAQEPYAPMLAALEGQLAALRGALRQQALRGADWLARLLPELEEAVQPRALGWQLSAEQERRLSFAAVARFLANVAAPAGIVLLLDDLQWASADALDLLASLVRADNPSALRVVGAYRDTDVRAHHPLTALIGDLAHDGLVRQRLVEPLGRADADELARRLLSDAGQAADTLRAQVLQRAGGVPFFLVSCAEGWREGALTAEANGGAQVPWGVAETIRQRVEAQPEAAREALEIVAIAGRATPRRVLLQVGARPERDMLDALDAVCRSRLLVEEGTDAYAFAHDLLQEAVHSGLSAARRATLHLAIGEALAQDARPVEPATLAHHFLLGGDDARAAIYLERAGDHARSVFAHLEAAAQYQALVDTLSRLGRSLEAAAAREKLADVLSTLGRYDDALAAVVEAESTYWNASRAADARRVCAAEGWLHATRGTPDEGLSRVDMALASYAHGRPMPGVAALHVARAQLCFVSGRYADQLEAAEAAVSAAAAEGDERTLTAAEDRRALALVLLGRIAEATEILTTRVLPAAESFGDLGTMTRALDTLAWAADLYGDFAGMAKTMERALALVEPVGEAGEIAFILFRRAEAAFYWGDWTTCDACLARAAEEASRVGGTRYAAFPALGQGAVALARGEKERAAAYLRTALDHAERTNDMMVRRVAQSILAERDLLAGDAAGAMARLRPVAGEGGPEETNALELYDMLAWAHLELGDLDRADELLGHMLRRAADHQLRPARADALRIAALVATRRGAWESAAEALDEAIALCRAMPYPYGEARAHYFYAQLERDRGRADRARQRLRAAREILDRLGERLLAGYVARVEAELTGE